MAEALRAPQRKPARKPEHGLARRLGRAALKGLRRQPAMAAALVIFGSLGAMTVVNALVLQTNRHPALLFADVSDTRVAPKAQNSKVAVMQPPKSANGFRNTNRSLETPPEPEADPFILDLQNELARRGYYTGAIDGKTGHKTEAAIRKYEERIGLPVTGTPSPLILRKLATTPDPAAAKDSDSDPLRGVIQEATPPAPEKAIEIRKVQQALNALDFGPLEEDGMMGAATRQAIERFERSRKLEPTGEPSGKTLKALQKASGIAMN